MAYLDNIRKNVTKWSPPAIAICGAIAAFGTYTCMYAFRKAFAAATFEGMQFLHVDYKVWLVIAQVLGYTVSKFVGIRFIAQARTERRAYYILSLIGTAWFSLLLFALIPAPWNIPCLFLNGFPLGMIWGLVFSYVEGRRATELMAAILSVSLIFASGFVKTIGRNLLALPGINQFWMPFLTGALFALPLLAFLFVLEIIPPPSAEDIKLRAKRHPMSTAERKAFTAFFLPGILFTIIIYVLLTIMRDMRDNFEVEIWASVGVHSSSIYTQTDSVVAVVVLGLMSLLILIKNNLKAFMIIHGMILSGCLILGAATVLFTMHLIPAVVWMTLAGLGVYLGYIPYNAVFFDRMISTFKYQSNVGFIIYIADSVGYLGSVSVLLLREFSAGGVSWGQYFRNGTLLVSVIGAVTILFSAHYFYTKAKLGNQPKTIDEAELNLRIS